MHLKSFAKRNWVEGWLVFAGFIILIAQFLTAKYSVIGSGFNHMFILGAPLDDTYIHTRFAENIFHGLGYCFNPGQIVSADTSPLWVCLIAIGGFFTTHFDLLAFGLSALAWLLIAPVVYRTARYLFEWEKSFSIVAAICILLSPRLLAMALSGMETTFATLLLIIVVRIHYRGRELKALRLSEAVVLALGIALRPEFYLLTIIIIADWLILVLQKKIRLRNFSFFFLLLLFLSHFVFSIPLHENGSFLFHSSIVQGVGFHFPPDLYYIGRSFYILLENFGWVILLLLLYLFSFRLPKITAGNVFIILFLILLPIFQGFFAPQYRHFGRYIFPLLPLMVLVMIAILRENMISEKGFSFFRAMKDSKRTWYLAIIAIIFSLPLTLKWIDIYADSVGNINDQHLVVSDWITDNIPQDEKIAADDVGATGYFTKRHIIDLTGLISPEFFLLQSDQSLVWKEARRQGANLFIIYRRLNPTFYQFARDSLDLIKEFRVRPPLVASADTVMSVFRVKGDSRAAR